MVRSLVFNTVAEAVKVLGHKDALDRLRALESLGYDLRQYTQIQLAKFLCCRRETLNRALARKKQGRIKLIAEAAALSFNATGNIRRKS
jgi:hypothetical protein